MTYEPERVAARQSQKPCLACCNLHESLAHECLKADVCILYASPCAPLLVLWPGEVEGTSVAMAQGKT